MDFLFGNFKRRSFGFVFLFLTLASLRAYAHPLDLGVLVIKNRGTHFAVRLEVNPVTGARLLNLNAPILDDAVFQSHKQELFDQTLGLRPLLLNKQKCFWSPEFTLAYDSPTVLSLVAAAECNAGAGDFTVELPFLNRLDASYNLLAKVNLNGHERIQGADPAHTTLNFSLAVEAPGRFQFVILGLEHIGLWPSEWHSAQGWHLPAGLDHIFFVLALLMAGDGLVTLLKMVTGFTVGHTFSLTLAAFGVVHVPGRWIELLVALTIAGVAAEGVFKFRLVKEWKLCVLIGLVHGLGFAAALTDLQLQTWALLLAIFGFNFGVELGQAFIISTLYPALSFARAHAWSRLKLLRSFRYLFSW